MLAHLKRFPPFLVHLCAPTEEPILVYFEHEKGLSSPSVQYDQMHFCPSPSASILTRSGIVLLLVFKLTIEWGHY